MQRQEKGASPPYGPRAASMPYSNDDIALLVPPAFPQSSTYGPDTVDSDPQPLVPPSFLYPPAATLLPPAAAAAASSSSEGAAAGAVYFPIGPPIGTTIASSWGSAASTPVSYQAGARTTFSPRTAAGSLSAVDRGLSTPFLHSMSADPLLAYDMLSASRQVRHGFMRKVLGLIILQLLLTVALAAPVVHNKQVRQFLKLNPWALVLSSVVAFTVVIILACSEAARRTHPTNLVLLSVFTLTEGLLVGVASATYNTHALMNALVWTAVAMMVMVVYALQTRVDFTSEGGTLYAALTILLLVGVARLCFRVKMLEALMSGCGALVFSAYFIFDVQLMASEQRSDEGIGPDEYVFAALNIYIDVINLFLYVLQRVQGSQSEQE